MSPASVARNDTSALPARAGLGLKPQHYAEILATSPRVHQCLAAHLAAHSFGVSVQDGLCIAPGATFATTTQPFTSVLAQVAASPHATTRR